MKSMRVLLLALVALLCVAGQVMAQANANWPQWRGPNRDGISKETGLLKQWPADGPPLAWKAKGAGTWLLFVFHIKRQALHHGSARRSRIRRRV